MEWGPLEPPEPDDDPLGDELSPAPLAVAPPRPRDAVTRAHHVRRRFRDRRDYLRLDLGESSAPASPKVLAALQRMDARALSTYPDPLPLQQALARLHGVDASCIAITAGTDEALRQVFATFVEEGSRVVLPQPTFGACRAAAEATGAFLERLAYDDDFGLPLDELIANLQRRPARLVALSNPNAPTGTALSPTVLRSMAHASTSTLFLINEAFVTWHGESLLDQGPPPPNVVVLRSFSKDHGLAGLRVGYLVGHPDVIEAIDVVRPSYTVSAPSLIGALAALQDPGAVGAHVALVRGVMDRLVARLAGRGLEAHATRANFVLVKLSAPIQPWAAGFAARRILVGTEGHVGPLADMIRITVNDDHEAERFLEALDLLLAHGVRGATRVDGVAGDWDEMDTEGMA